MPMQTLPVAALSRWQGFLGNGLQIHRFIKPAEGAMRITSQIILRRCVLMVFILSSGVFIQVAMLSGALTAKEPTMSGDISSVIDQPIIPAIDLDAPTKFETASFGLG